MVGIYWVWSPWWYVQLAIAFFIWLPIFLYRKGWNRKNELRGQLIFGFVSLFISFIAENFGVYGDLWHYDGGDWPVVLWILYFAVGVSSFQLFKFIDEKWVKSR